MELSFKQNQSLAEFQKFIERVYGLPDDRLYAIWDLLSQQQRFTMRALKGIRKNDQEKIKVNLLIAFSWLAAIANRFHIDLEEEIWQRFPAKCSYCGACPCECKKIKIENRNQIIADESLQPKTLAEIQQMFEKIYPSSSRSLADAGVHLAEEMGEVSEAIHNFLGQHENQLFNEIKLEVADFTSCLMGVANSAEVKVADELAKMYFENCHVCHQAPCVCTFASVAKLKT